MFGRGAWSRVWRISDGCGGYWLGWVSRGKDWGTEGAGQGERCEEDEGAGGGGREEGEDKGIVVMTSRRRYRSLWRLSQACISG